MEIGGPRDQTVRGTLFPTKRDIGNQSVHLVVGTVEQDAYFLNPNNVGRELTAFVHREVEITGTLRETDEGDFIFTVKTYRLLDDSDQAKTPLG